MEAIKSVQFSGKPWTRDSGSKSNSGLSSVDISGTPACDVMFTGAPEVLPPSVLLDKNILERIKLSPVLGSDCHIT